MQRRIHATDQALSMPCRLTDLDLHVVDVPLGGGVPAPLPLGALARRRRPRVELAPHRVRRPRRLAVLLELRHVDVVVAQQRVRVLQRVM